MKSKLKTFLVSCGLLFVLVVSVSAEEWLWPVPSNLHVFQPFKSTHSGLDISQNAYNIVYATKSGTVITSKPYVCTHWSETSSSDHSSSCAWSSNDSLLTLGNYIEIDHGDGTISRYGHLCYGFNNSAAGVTIPMVSVGDYISQGTPIGIVGSSGKSGGQHLHFTIKKNGSNFNTNPANNSLITSNNSKYSNADICNGGTINYIATASLYKAPGQSVPVAPTITSVSTVSTSSLKVKWNAVSGATSYRIDRRISGGDAYSTIVSSTTSTSFTDTGLQAGSKYYYRVYALNGSATSGRSETAGAYTQCEKPTINNISSTSTDSITIGWTDVKGASSYRIDRRDNDSYTTIATGITTNSFTDTGLEPGTKHFYRVYAVNENSVSEKPDGYRAFSQCEKPVINSVSSTSTDSITIGWNGVVGATSYRIDRRDNDSYTTIATGITTNDFTDTGLVAGSKHFYRVYAVNDNSVSAKPDGYRAFVQCEMPVISKLTANNTGSITIIWNGVNGATAYRIDRRKKGADAYQTIVESTTDTNYTDTGLVAGSMYYYRIYALNDNSISAKPDGVGVYTKFVYNIKYDANSGGGAPADQEKEEDATIKISTVIPVRTGYTFKNWNTKADGSGIDYNAGGSYTANTTTTLYAQWRANIYNVAYNANGGVGKDVTSTHTYNTEATLNENTFTRDGYSFAGWSTDKSATSETYVDKQSVKNLTEVDGETVTLYAIWVEDEVEEPIPTQYSFGQSVQIGLIEPWFIKANLLVYTDSISKPIDYSTLVDYGAYFIRKSELSDSSLTQNTISNEDILSNPNVIKKSKLEGTATIDGSLLAANYDKGLYTYEMSDSLFVLFYVEDENGIQYAPIRERNIKNLLDERKNNAESFTNVLERNVYDKMSTLEANIKKYRAQFSEISKLPEMGAPKLSEHIVNNGAFTEETVETYTFGNSVQLVLVEPWGLKVNAIVQKNGSLIDYNSVEEYGAIVFYDIDGEIACGRMTQEELRTKNDAYVFSNNKGIYTYQLNSNAYVMFYVKDAAGYHYGDVKVRNAYELAKTRGADTSGNYGEQEKVVYQDMVTMYETVTEYRDDYFSKN